MRNTDERVDGERLVEGKIDWFIYRYIMISL